MVRVRSTALVVEVFDEADARMELTGVDPELVGGDVADGSPDRVVGEGTFQTVTELDDVAAEVVQGCERRACGIASITTPKCRSRRWT